MGNTGIGAGALEGNTTGNYNTANSYQALFSSVNPPFHTGDNNTVNGAFALYQNTSGSGNTANGFQALQNNTMGSRNIALGFNAGADLTTGSDNIDIGNRGVAGDANMIRIGTAGTQTDAFVAGIFGSSVANGVGVVVNSSGKLGTILSSERFKEDIKAMDKASEALLALKPVTFRYKREIDPTRISQFGLVAEEVAKVDSDLVVRDEEGKPYTVRYEAVNAMLLNEFLKEHRRVEELEANDAQQQKEIKALKAELKEHAAQIQKVSAELEASKPAPQVVNNR